MLTAWSADFTNNFFVIDLQHVILILDGAPNNIFATYRLAGPAGSLTLGLKST